MWFNRNKENVQFDLDAYIQALKNACAPINIPELKKTIAELNCIRTVTLNNTELVVDAVLPTFALRSEKEIASEIKKTSLELAPTNFSVKLNVYSDVQPAATQSIKKDEIANVKNIILVASGKGGVGKSTVASNLACSLARLGCSVGLLDADVYGPSVPIMFGVEKDVKITGLKGDKPEETYMIPVERHGVRLMSIGFLVDADAPLVWRGPMIASASMQMFYNVAWGELDYLIVDLPPGTGDIQLSIAQKVVVAGAIIVSTPQDVALADVIRAKAMFDNVNIPCLGVVENMSYFVCDGCDKRHEIFTHGGARKAADGLNVPFLEEIPIEKLVREGGDAGVPSSVKREDLKSSQAFTNLAHTVAAKLATIALNGIDAPTIKIKGATESPTKKRSLPVVSA